MSNVVADAETVVYLLVGGGVSLLVTVFTPAFSDRITATAAGTLIACVVLTVFVEHYGDRSLTARSLETSGMSALDTLSRLVGLFTH